MIEREEDDVYKTHHATHTHAHAHAAAKTARLDKLLR